ncbi:ribonuclease D [Marinicauda pacifica]|uniref:Ribonuclease D n=1 Tax=Marinicauda pacifica TaxID=1133559 RepID=A0A4S2HEM0_9PROT|nr:ribonuclease D [Marinicauda pacifica]TGY94333.1 ribonuclease D [Marinicauda pacifica]GGE34936.1 ribonuclease D [Marinicauda pacifica]
MKLITTTSDLAAACDALAQNDFVALDTEFMRETTFWPQLCLIQAAGGETEVLIDPLSEEIDLEPLFELLRDTSVVKVFHACRQDLEIFFHKGGELIPNPLFDTQIAAMAVGLGDSISYDNLVGELLGRAIDKGSRFTDWSRRPLSEKQLTYALADVTHLRDLYPKLQARLKTSNREHWVGEEMKTLTNPDTYRMDPEQAWKRLKLRKTTKKWLAALRAAAAWREREAQTRDIPRNRIIKDDGLYELAHAAPTELDQLTGLRAVPKGFERSKPAERLIEALNAALDNADSYAPKVSKSGPPPSNLGPVVELLKVFLRVVAEDEGVAPRLIATVPDLEAIAADDEADVGALKGWRRTVFGQRALELKRGEIALVLENGKVEAIELED